MRRYVLVAAAAAALALGAIGTAAAAIMPDSLTLDSDATMKANGRAIVVNGWVQCHPGQRVKITANPVIGPTALGRTSFACSGDRQSFEVTVRMRGNGIKFSDMGSTQIWVNAFTDDGFQSESGPVNWLP